jgi:hypothetical protein
VIGKEKRSNMKYHEPEPIDWETAEKNFLSDDPEIICETLLAVTLHAGDWRRVQGKCLSFLENRNTSISGLAATCLGHIARIHQQLDKKKVIAALKAKLDNKEIRGNIEDALDDIKIFMK